MSYVQVTEDEADSPIELPVEEDDSLLLSTLTSHFPDASGLKFRNPESGGFRGLRLKGVGQDSRLQPPEKGWGQSSVYFVVRPKGKRRSDDSETTATNKLKKTEAGRSQQRCSDLIVLGLAWKTTETELKEYFEKFGSVVMTQVKKDNRTGESKGFGFVRFDSFEVQSKVTATRHSIGGRMCDVRIPLSRGHSYQQSEFSRKIFVGRLTEEVSCDDLRDYFAQFGEVIDVFIPKPFRAFAFLTFSDSEVAQSLCGEDHLVRCSATGATVSVHVSNAVPKQDVSETGFSAIVNGTSARRTPSLTNHSSVHHRHHDPHMSSRLQLSQVRHYATPSPSYHPPLYSFNQHAHLPPVWARDGLSAHSSAATGPHKSYAATSMNLAPSLHHLPAPATSMLLFGQQNAAVTAAAGGNGSEEALLGSGETGGGLSVPGPQ